MTVMSIDEKLHRRESRKEEKLQKKEEKLQKKEEKYQKREEKRAERKLNYAEKKANRADRKAKTRKIMATIGRSILENCIYLFHIILSTILNLILEKCLGPKRICPDSNTKLITKSASELAQLIKKGELKSYDLVKAYTDRIEAINGSINAIVDGPFKEALDEGKLIDEKISKGLISEDEFAEKPFLGIPFTTKDSTAVKDKLLTFGLISRKNYRATEDAECIRLIKEAGGIIIATSNVPEVNKWIETRNMLIGQTNNPYDLRRSVGGSSGGESALISACGTAFGIGTDIGGSIRIPSFCCGIFGHKPTTGVVNMRGCTLRTGKDQNTMVAAGPMSRYSCDLVPLLKILVDPKSAVVLKLDEKVDLKQLKYYYVPQNNMLKCSPVTKENQAMMFSICEHFADITGEQVNIAVLPGLEMSANMWRYWMTQEPSDFIAILGNGIKLNPFVELTKKILGKSQFTMAAIYSLIDGILPKENADKIHELTRKLDECLSNLLGDNGILFFHSSPQTAPFHYYNLIQLNDFHYFSIFNVLKVPATQVPMGLDSKGLPLGVQVVATRNRDKDCLAVAEELERTFGGWVAPFNVNE